MNGEKTVPIGFFAKISAFLGTAFAVIGLMSSTVHAQGADAQAIALKKEAMSAYGNLDLDSAVQQLDQAAALGPQLSPNTVAQIYVSYGIVFVGGNGDNAKGQDYFTIARCLDATVSIDPLYSTPEVDMIFKMAQSRVSPQTCTSLLANVSYQGGAAQPVAPVPVQPMPVQPMPVQPGMLPPCGMHNSPMQQRKSTELPLMLQVDPGQLQMLDKIVIKYAYDGGSTYFDMLMVKGQNGWVTGMLTCDEGQITAFDPSVINYYIEGYDMVGGLVCGNGSSAQPYTVAMDPNAAIISGIPGMATPQTCQECPPWDQDCHAAKGSATPCFADDECQPGQWCSDTGYCEGDVAGGEGFDDPAAGGSGAPQKFYVNLSAGTGVGFVKSPNTWYITSAIANASDPRDTFFTYMVSGVSQGAAGGLPLRGHLGFVLGPKIALELGARLDASFSWRKQKNVIYCADSRNSPQHGDVNSAYNYTCHAPVADYQKHIYGAWLDSNGRVVSAESSSNKALILNARVKGRFINKDGNQLSIFGGLGWGHLFFAPKVSDMDLDGADDRIIATPGMINVELGLGFAHYFSKNFGFIVELPIDVVLGEDSTFGFNTDLMLGISFGG